MAAKLLAGEKRVGDYCVKWEELKDHSMVFQLSGPLPEKDKKLEAFFTGVKRNPITLIVGAKLSELSKTQSWADTSAIAVLDGKTYAKITAKEMIEFILSAD